MAIKAVANGKTFTFPDSTSKEDAADAIDNYFKSNPAIPAQPTQPDQSYLSQVGQNLGDEAAGLVRGAGSIGATILGATVDPLARAVGVDPNSEVGGWVGRTDRRQAMDEGLKSMGANPDSNFFKAGKLTSEIGGTAALGGAIAKVAAPIAANVPALAPIIEAIGSNGMIGGNIATRAAGGAIAGGASTAAIDPESAGTGAAIGGGIPLIGASSKYLGGAAWQAIKPFLKSGQEDAALKKLLEHAENPEAVMAAIKAQTPELVAGSTPTTAAVTGDVGLSGLQRTMHSKPNMFPTFGNDLTLNSIQQNSARNAAMEEIAGNTGKISAAETAREAATGKMRDDALNAAGHIDSKNITSGIDDLLSKPDNAGKLSQQALKGVKSQLQEFTDDNGKISARAVYAIRKDINDVLEGKLQGDAGNLKYASSQLKAVKQIIDDSIEAGPSKTTGTGLATIKTTGKEVNPLNIQGAQSSAQEGAAASDASFKNYLKTYSDMSKPIDQMKKVQEILTQARTGAIRGNDYVLSGNSLNRIIKNNGDELSKLLSPDQMQRLRNVAADASAEEQAMNVGRPVGSNTDQNLNSGELLKSIAGKTIGGSTGARTLGRALNFIYKIPNEETVSKLSDLMLSPDSAKAAVLNYEKAQAKSQKLNSLLNPSSTAIARLAPASSVQDWAKGRQNSGRK